MKLPLKTYRQVGRLALVVTVWSGCFVILAILADLLLEKYFRGDGDALFEWLLALDKRHFSYAVIFWLFVASVLAVVKLQERWRKPVANSLQTRGLIK